MHVECTHFIEHSQENVECVELGLNGVLTVHFELEAVTEELQDGCYQLMPSTQVLDVGKSEKGRNET